MSRGNLRRTLTSAALALMGYLLILGSPVFAQISDNAALRGTVTDAMGAVVPGVDVVVTGEATGVKYSTVTDSSGDYELPAIRPGTYTMTVSGPRGFKKSENKGVIVYATRLRRIDVSLEVGEVTETVTVEARGSIIQTDTASITYTLPRKEVYATNEPNQAIYSLARHPGAEPRSQVHGTYANNTVAEVDGFATNAYGFFRAPQETVSEINQVSITAPAQYRTATTVEVVGRSGANRPHGEFFANLTHQRLSALARGLETRPRPQKGTVIFSGEFSGPIVIPKVYDGRNKTFVHFLYTKNSSSLDSQVPGYVVPTTKMRAGDLSEYAAFRRITTPSFVITNPYTGAAFANDTIPANMFSPIAVNALKLVPTSNYGPPGAVVGNYLWTNSSTSGISWLHLRFDHSVSDRNVASFSIYDSKNPSKSLNSSAPGDGGVDAKGVTRAYATQDTHTFTPRLVNVFHFAFNSQAGIGNNGRGSGKQILQTELGITDLGGRTVPDALGSPHIIVQTLGGKL